MPLIIIKARQKDISDVVRLNGVVQDLHARLSPDIFRADWVVSDLEDFWSARLEEKDSTVKLAQLNGSVVGYIWFQLQNRERDALHLARTRIYVHHIAVDESARGEGVGAKLLNEVEREARRLGISTVVLDVWATNSTAQGFFGSLGYVSENIVLSKIFAIP